MEMSHMNESCPIWMSHVSHEWVMSHTNDSCFIFHGNESCPIWMSHVPYAWVMSHMPVISHGNEWCPMSISHEWVTCLARMSQVSIIWPCLIYRRRQSCPQNSSRISTVKRFFSSYFFLFFPSFSFSTPRFVPVVCMQESFKACEWVMSHTLTSRAHMWMSHVSHMDRSFTHVNESCHTHGQVVHTCEWVMSHTWTGRAHMWMSNVTHMDRSFTHVNESCLISDVTWLVNICVTWLIQMWHMTSFICVTWHITWTGHVTNANGFFIHFFFC